jgi:hypothetical protein
MGFVPIGGCLQPPLSHCELDGQKSSISDRIEQISKASDNLCLPNCIFQALRTLELRKAFSAHNLKEVFKAFLEISAGERINPKTGKVINRAKEGYFPQDVTRYLDFLKDHIYTKSHVFMRLQPLALRSLFVKLFTKSESVGEQVFVFFGYTLPSDEKPKMVKRFEDLRKSLCSGKYSRLSGEKQRIAVELDMIKFYNNLDEMATLRKRFQISNYKHGISIGIEKDKSMWLYDNGNKVRKPVSSIEHVAPYLLSYWDVYVFKMSLW